MSWQTLVHAAIAGAENVAEHIVAGLAAVRDSQMTATLVKEIPSVEPFVAKLIDLISGFGTANATLNVVDWGVEHWQAIAAIGAAAHFAPADVLTQKSWMDPTDPGARQE